jgi:hypothetical protein
LVVPLCACRRVSRTGIADTAARDLGKALVEGRFPENSAFASDEGFGYQEVTGRDTVPLANGGLSVAGAAASERLPAVQRPEAPACGVELPAQQVAR